jgi:PEGA domain
MDMNNRVLFCLLLLLQSNTTPAPQQGTTPTSTPQLPTAACKQPCLEDGTPVRLRMSQTVSSADAHVDDRVEFEVLEDIKVADVIVIAKGGIAWGTVTEALPKRRMARGGKLEIVMDAVRLTDGEKAALRATKEGKGGGHTGAMTAGIVATAIVFFPAAPFFLFMHGKDITFPKGTEVPTFVDGNFTIDLSKFQSTAAPSESATSTPEPAQTAPNVNAEMNITSNPPGAEVQIDGVFVGNTPSTLGVSSGDHLVTVSKKGFKAWERKVKITTGKVELAAELDAEVK